MMVALDLKGPHLAHLADPATVYSLADAKPLIWFRIGFGYQKLVDLCQILCGFPSLREYNLAGKRQLLVSKSHPFC